MENEYRNLLKLCKAQTRALDKIDMDEFDRLAAARSALSASFGNVTEDATASAVIGQIVLDIHKEDKKIQKHLRREAARIMAELNSLRQTRSSRQSYAQEKSEHVLLRRGFHKDTPRCIDMSS